MQDKIKDIKRAIKELSIKHNISDNRASQYIFILYLLEIIAKSKYASNFILKGGFLVSNILTNNKRFTQDIDLSVINMEIEENQIKEIFKEILTATHDDKINAEIIQTKKIKTSESNKGITLKLLLTFKDDKRREYMSLDISKGDIITPKAILREIKSILSNNSFLIQTYNVETIIAEKLCSLQKFGSNTTRVKDFYDFYLFRNNDTSLIDYVLLKHAIENTFANNDIIFDKKLIFEHLDNMKKSKNYTTMWKTFIDYNSYANISWEEVIENCVNMLNKLP